ncbi:flagellar biosynthetic protein FlhB [Paenibacillus sophorae]|uniref:Flagellar biosynthetic protein FlhB n=1 Tax=Paenibacillus sophorae TaxID=1333845 RepID=A0A1H8GC53_9BACL|nr:flagellar biosynthesis protein FlhB [Paenibacillus sophorae]QWU14162.1 flagellar biosynthesis protein FlhB [Paenibacillus sophorae]SEN41077.1 flagellar biosynthetic protein FlhB [Paenibacillus sophorae]
MAYRYQLDLQLFGGEKTERATPRKRQDARRKGQVAKSAELSGALVLLSGVLSLMIFGGFMKERFTALYTDVFMNRLMMEVTKANVLQLMNEYGVQILILLGPMLGITFILALISSVAQVGFMVTGEGVTPKFSKINPIKGFRNIFSMRSLVEMLKSIFKLLVIAYLVFNTLWGQKDNFSSLSHVSAEDVFRFTAKMTLNLGIKIGAALLIMAVLDYMYQRYEHEKSLRMSKQEIKDEFKKMEGDPLIKGKIRERQRRMAMQRMMQEVPGADVIITNPTHFAVALKYDGSKMEAPQIVAKGQDYVALRIRSIAKEHGVMTMENKPLARALFQRAEIGDSVPADLFQAVAEVLAYVYKLKGRAR